MRTNARPDSLQTALFDINWRLYQGNVQFNRFDIDGRRVNFTLRVKSSRGPGSRRAAFSGRRLPCACWHVHGEFFAALFRIQPDAVVWTSAERGPHKITKDSGNWQDWNIGSQFQPVYFSEVCDCSSNTTPDEIIASPSADCPTENPKEEECHHEQNIH